MFCMVLYYTTKNKDRLIASAQNILSVQCETVEVSNVYENGIGRPAKKKVIVENDGGRYFLWNNERVYISNYDTFKVDEMVSFFATKGGNTHPVYVYSTIMKFSNDVAFILNPLPYTATKETIPPELFDANEATQMLFVPTDRNISKDKWDTTIMLTPNNKEHWKFFSDIVISFDELFNQLKMGKITIVNKQKFIKEYTDEIERFNKLSKMKQKRHIKKYGVPKRVML